MRRDLGDFQTPPALVSAVLRCLLRGRADGPWERVLEPTCGRGNFVAGVLRLPNPPREVQGIELQDAYVRVARDLKPAAGATRVVIHRADLFRMDLRRDLAWTGTGPLLVVGNPPWITSAEMSAIGGDNLPVKRNIKGLRGIEALTGCSNFDIAEYIWIKLIQELGAEQPTIALLCKTSVARSVLQYASQTRMPVVAASIHRITAAKWFGAAVDACLFTMQLGIGQPCYQAAMYSDLEATQPDSVMGIVDGQMVADVRAFNAGQALYHPPLLTWRQGLKHDAAAVMELQPTSGGYRNKLGKRVEVETEFIYPLLKSSDLAGEGYRTPRLSVVVPQHHPGEDTRYLEQAAPKLWAYLMEHRAFFENRKSAIYRGHSPFAIFGIGPYSFSPYKVAISGLHKRPLFRVITPSSGRPVMVDDTCYLVPCSSPQEAAILASLLNDEVCHNLLASLVFWDAKRPITKKLLQRIDLRQLLRDVDRERLLCRARAELAAATPAEVDGHWALERPFENWLVSLSGDPQLALPGFLPSGEVGGAGQGVLF